jgi:hypothetical protein
MLVGTVEELPPPPQPANVNVTKMNPSKTLRTTPPSNRGKMVVNYFIVTVRLLWQR